MSRVTDFGQPNLAVERILGDALCPRPHFRLVNAAQIFAFASKSELTGKMPVRILINHTAHIIGVAAGEDAVHYDLSHGHLTADGFAARLEIDCVGEAFFRFGARFAFQAQTFCRAFENACLVFARHGFVVSAGLRTGRKGGDFEVRVGCGQNRDRFRAGLPLLQRAA